MYPKASDIIKGRLTTINKIKNLLVIGIKIKIIKDINKTTIYYGNDTITIHDGYLDIGLIDTMEDLIVNFIGALFFSILGYFYIKHRDKYKGIEHFIPRKKLKS